MTIAERIELTAEQMHIRACDDVNRWRGHCIELFARIEREAGEALAAMAQADDGKRAKVPHMFGDRMKALSAAFAQGGTCPRPKIAKALADAADLLEQRNRLVHARSRILLDRDGNWVWQYFFRPSGKPEESGCVDAKEAGEVERALQRASQSVCAQLGALTAKLSHRPASN